MHRAACSDKGRRTPCLLGMSPAPPRTLFSPPCDNRSVDDRELLRHISRSAQQRAGYKQLVRELGLGGGRDRRLLLEHLARLTMAGKLVKLDREQWQIPQAAA